VPGDPTGSPGGQAYHGHATSTDGRRFVAIRCDLLGTRRLRWTLQRL